MSLEGEVGSLYCLIGLIHITIFAIKKVRTREFSDPMDAWVAAFAWPLVDVMWLRKRFSTANR